MSRKRLFLNVTNNNKLDQTLIEPDKGRFSIDLLRETGWCLDMGNRIRFKISDLTIGGLKAEDQQVVYLLMEGVEMALLNGESLPVIASWRHNENEPVMQLGSDHFDLVYLRLPHPRYFKFTIRDLAKEHIPLDINKFTFACQMDMFFCHPD